MSEPATIAAALRVLARDIHCEDGVTTQCLHEDADMLDFLLGQMQSHSLRMDGTASYRPRSGWPMTYARGRSAEEAVRAAMREACWHATRAKLSGGDSSATADVCDS
jgi:hypothetical protein